MTPEQHGSEWTTVPIARIKDLEAERDEAQERAERANAAFYDLDGYRDKLEARVTELEGALRLIEGGHAAANHRKGCEQLKAVAREALASTPQPSSPFPIVECPECGHAIRVSTPSPARGDGTKSNSYGWTTRGTYGRADTPAQRGRD